MDLKQLQGLIYKSITSPEMLPMGLSHDADPSLTGIDLLVLGDERLSALERVDIYANAYFYRLFDCLIEEFPATLRSPGSGKLRSSRGGLPVAVPTLRALYDPLGSIYACLSLRSPLCPAMAIHSRTRKAGKGHSRRLPCSRCPNIERREPAQDSVAALARS